VLQACPHLQVLDLSDTAIADADVAQLVADAPGGLTELYVVVSPFSGPTVLPLTTSCRRLKRCSGVTGAVFGLLRSLLSLRVLSVAGALVTPPLVPLPGLTALDISATPLFDGLLGAEPAHPGALALLASLGAMPLRWLDVSCTAITRPLLRALLVRHAFTLQTLRACNAELDLLAVTRGLDELSVRGMRYARAGWGTPVPDPSRTGSPRRRISSASCAA
jgi:hypothetical protein